jgi:hypothetical protein
MATAIGDLVVRLGMDSKKFSQGARGAVATVQGLSKSIGGYVAAGLAMVGVTASVTAGIVALKRQFDAVDAAAKMSDRIGISTEALVGLQHQAELAGTSSDDLMTSLDKMSKTVGEAVALDKGEGKDALKAMGLDAPTLAKMSPEKQFGAIGDALDKIESKQVRVALATKVFGRGATSLTNTLAGGSRAMREAAADAEFLGVIFGRDVGRKIEGANDAIFRVKQAFSGIFRGIAAVIAPDLERFSNSVANTIARIREPFLKALLGYKVYATTVMGLWRELGAAVVRFVEPLKTTFAPFAEQAKSAFQTVVENLDVMLGSVEGFKAGALNIWMQLTLGIEALGQIMRTKFMLGWEGVKLWWKTLMIDIAIVVERMVQRGIKALQKLGKLVGVDIPGLADATQAMAALRTKAETDANQEIERIRAEHQRRMASIGARSDAWNAIWQQQKSMLPKLSDQVAEAWKSITAPSETIAPPGVDEFATKDKGKRYGAAAEKGSAEAYSILVNSRKDGDKTAKAQLAQAKLQTTALQRIDENIRKTNLITIPTA